MDTLVAAAERRYREALDLQGAARAVDFDTPFTVNGGTYTKRKPCTQADQSRIYVLQDGSEKRIDTQYVITRAFMTWTIIELLRHTGIRIEEMLELTHLSVKQYRKPDGSVIPLLQIAPSKTDQERVFPCSPELMAPHSPDWSPPSASTVVFRSAAASTGTSSARCQRRCRISSRFAREDALG